MGLCVQPSLFAFLNQMQSKFDEERQFNGSEFFKYLVECTNIIILLQEAKEDPDAGFC